MSDIEELAHLLDMPGGDLDWGAVDGEPFCFLEYERTGELPPAMQSASPALAEEQQQERPPSRSLRPRPPLRDDSASNNKRRITEAFVCDEYPSHTCGPVLVPAPAQEPAMETSVAAIIANAAPAPAAATRAAPSPATTGGSSRRASSRAAAASPATMDDAATQASSSSVGSSMGKGSSSAQQGNGSGREAAVAQRMERKKTREKMRRQEVNDRFQELMEALEEVDKEGKERPASPAAPAGNGDKEGKQEEKEHQHGPGSHGLSCAAAGCDKGNFRVDVLSRAVRALRRLHEEVKTERDEVERLRQLLDKASLSSSSSSSAVKEEAAITTTAPSTPIAAPTAPAPAVKEEVEVQEQEQQQPEPEPQPQPQPQQQPAQQPTAAVPAVAFPSAPAVPAGNGKPLDAPTPTTAAPPMQWVTVPMWMPNPAAAKGAGGVGLPHMPHMAPGCGPFAAMPFFMPNPSGGAPLPAMPAHYLMPTPGGVHSGAAMGMGAGFGPAMMEVTPGAGDEDMGDGELPTHAPCA